MKNFYVTIPSDIIIQRIILSLQTTGEMSNNQLDVYTIFGIHDDINRLFTNEKFTLLNISWKKFQEQTKIDIWDLWPDLQVKESMFLLYSISYSFRITRKNEHYSMLVFIQSYISIIFHL